MIDEPLEIHPGLANGLGLNESIILMRLYRILEKGRNCVPLHNQMWFPSTLPNWQKQHFPFWSQRTIERAFTELEELGYIVSCQPEGMDRRKYYQINTVKLIGFYL